MHLHHLQQQNELPITIPIQQNYPTTTNTTTTSSLLRPTSIAILTRLSKSPTIHVHTPTYTNPSTSIIPITIIEEPTQTPVQSVSTTS